MELSALKSQIKSGQIKDLYIFTGPEITMQNIYIEQMSKRSGKSVARLSSITELLQKLKSSSLVKNAQICVFRDCKELISDDKLNVLIRNEKRKNDNIYIFIYTSIDKRTKFYKTYSDEIVNFDYLKADILIKYIKKEIELSGPYANKLVEICENDYGRILLEIDKIKIYSAVKNIDVDEAFNVLIDEGVIYQPPYDAIFDFVEAVLAYKVRTAYRLLEECYVSGEATLVILANLYNSTKQLLQVQTYEGNNLAKASSLTPFQIKLAKGRLDVYEDERLEEFMLIVRDAEVGIKTGKIEDSIAVEYVLARFWNGRV